MTLLANYTANSRRNVTQLGYRPARGRELVAGRPGDEIVLRLELDEVQSDVLRDARLDVLDEVARTVCVVAKPCSDDNRTVFTMTKS